MAGKRRIVYCLTNFDQPVLTIDAKQKINRPQARNTLADALSTLVALHLSGRLEVAVGELFLSRDSVVVKDSPQERIGKQHE